MSYPLVSFGPMKLEMATFAPRRLIATTVTAKSSRVGRELVIE